MSTHALEQFQEQVSQLLLRHRSVLDIMSKLDQTSASINRTVTKSITDCGCIELHASKQPFHEVDSLDVAQQRITNHVTGELCEHCKELVQQAIGSNLFYLTALCTQLDIKLPEVLEQEAQKCNTLGLFNLT
ncbi:hypothetical protein J40TS1_51360 [Paenibacillus montaniterrae]|uniref:DUF1573 domain-containing protein n=1 Tax=Paenibacillus montaniterrae TaxID=429341 RepID=A0A920D218_9BACL|nr:DUF1573 domain-containing protein [Paenibacillus montaniterrae]GIP19494.1 hypothetical protein J40TS1_51360 [Paenibacillus montaniterrae]